MIRASRSTIAVLGSAALAVGSIVAAGASAAAPSQHTLAGSRPAWATSSHRVGSTAGSQAVDFKMYLPWRHSAAAEKYAMDASTSGNARSGKFLTPAQFRSRYAPSKAQVSSVKSWLRTQGFKVTSVPSNNRYVEARGDVSTAAKAFKTSFAQYRVQGIELRSNTTQLTVPSSLGVDAVTGLDESYGLVHSQATPPAVFKNAQPCSSYWGEKTVQNTSTPDGTKLPDSPSAFAPCGYAGAQLQGAYGLDPTAANDGSGVTVAVIDAYASPTIKSDANTYFDRHGLDTFKPGQFKQIVSPGTYNRPENNKQDPQGWSGEETLDIEAVHTAAPGANILYVGAPNNHSDLDAALNKVVNGHLASVVTNSYGYAGEALPKGYIKPFNDTMVQAAATGISVFFSSGDSADETGGDPTATPTPDWPASSPWTTAVGGTSLGVDENNTRLFELGWETGRSSLDKAATKWNDPTFQYGSGGGTSRLFAQPSYQQGVVPTSMSEANGSSRPMRVVPDVAAIGDPNTGMLIGQTQRFPDGTDAYSEYRIGGTSLASPLYAGMFALAVQKHGEYGLANPALYSAQGTTNDITTAKRDTYPGDVRADYVNGVDDSQGYSYTARWFDRDEPLTIHVRDGYDDVTGIGSPNGVDWLASVVAYH